MSGSRYGDYVIKPVDPQVLLTLLKAKLGA